MEEKKGVWRTVRGRRIFIAEGEDLYTAMKNSGKFKELNRGEYQKAKAEVDFKTRRDEYEQDTGTGENGIYSAKQAKMFEEQFRERSLKEKDDSKKVYNQQLEMQWGRTYRKIKNQNKEKMKEAEERKNRLYDGPYYDNPVEAMNIEGLEGKHLTPKERAKEIDKVNKEFHYAGEELYSDDPYRYMSEDKMRAYNEKMQNWQGKSTTSKEKNELSKMYKGPGDYYINDGKDGYYSVNSQENFNRMLKENPNIKSIKKQTVYSHGDFGEKRGKYWDNKIVSEKEIQDTVGKVSNLSNNDLIAEYNSLKKEDNSLYAMAVRNAYENYKEAKVSNGKLVPSSTQKERTKEQVTYKGKKYNITEVRNEGYFEGQNADEENPGTFAEHTPKRYRIENPNDKSDWGWVTDKDLKTSKEKVDKNTKNAHIPYKYGSHTPGEFTEAEYFDEDEGTITYLIPAKLEVTQSQLQKWNGKTDYNKGDIVKAPYDNNMNYTDSKMQDFKVLEAGKYPILEGKSKVVITKEQAKRFEKEYQATLSLTPKQKARAIDDANNEGKAIVFDRKDETFKYTGSYSDDDMRNANADSQQIEKLGSYVYKELSEGRISRKEAESLLEVSTGGVPGIMAGNGYYHIRNSLFWRDKLEGTEAYDKIYNQMNYWNKKIKNFKK